jgi:hypothetical protein
MRLFGGTCGKVAVSKIAQQEKFLLQKTKATAIGDGSG